GSARSHEPSADAITNGECGLPSARLPTPRSALPVRFPMSNALKCPNSTCPYLFDPTGVPTGAVLNCPRCGMRFTLGPPAPAPPPAATTPPGYAAQPRPTPDHYPPPPEPRNGRTAREPLPPGYSDGSTRMTIFWVVFTVAILFGAALMVYFQAFHEPEPPPT